jgi:biotin-dependent carboxylase-like uncharacterized protein
MTPGRDDSNADVTPGGGDRSPDVVLGRQGNGWDTLSGGRGLRDHREGSGGDQGIPARELLVVTAGPLTTVQDRGRSGWAHLGVGEAGAADRAALRLANRLVGNHGGAAGLEVTLGGLLVRTTAALTVAVTGAGCPVTVDGVPHPARAVLELPSGAELALGPASGGLRAYLGVRGGIAVPAVLGSRSTDTLGGLGPPIVRDGDRLPIGPQDGDAVVGWPVIDLAPPPAGPAWTDPVRLVAIPGPRDAALGPGGLDLLASTSWEVSERSDRVGVRLLGPALPVTDSGSVASEGVVRGGIQIPPGGRPVLFGADHPVTGGYPVVAVLIEASADRAAQLRPGERVVVRLVPPPAIDAVLAGPFRWTPGR